MTTKTRTPVTTSKYTLGRSHFAKISEVEGIRTSERLEAEFRTFDHKGLSAEERRRILTAKFTRRG